MIIHSGLFPWNSEYLYNFQSLDEVLARFWPVDSF